MHTSRLQKLACKLLLVFALSDICSSRYQQFDTFAITAHGGRFVNGSKKCFAVQTNA
jgi:hypothetical protein